ncbi:MAG: hypothetical protein HY454_01205 [Parcubacteria group bacterium]|nr:hypothetical protein [Parcubacteria group bacterium]
MARKDVSILVSAAGWIGGFTDKLVRALRERGVSDEQIHSFVTDEGEVPVGKIADMLAEMLAKCASNVCGIFQLVLEGTATASELIRRGQYNWHNNWITDERFPLQTHDQMGRTIELVEFDHDPTSEEVLAEFIRRGLERSTYEDALYFGIQHPEEQRKRPIVFLHEPVLDPCGRRGVLVLGGDAGGRKLLLVLVAGGWDRDFVFAGVRK